MKKHRVRDFQVGDNPALKSFVGELRFGGFQATEIGNAVDAIKEMRASGSRVFFSFTANMMAAGLRGVFIQLTERGLIDVVVTTGGSIDHDIIRSYKDYLVGEFKADDVRLRQAGVNRIGNIFVPSQRYDLLEKKVQPILESAYKKKKIWSPRDIILELSKPLKNEKSFLGACLKNNIPVYTPNLLDSALGLQIYFFKQERPDFIIDATGDINQFAETVLTAEKTGAIILGGGTAKHYTLGANLLRGGLDYAVYVTTAHHSDGSLSGAPPSEGVSWGKVREKKKTAVVYGDATVVFPLIVAGL